MKAQIQVTFDALNPRALSIFWAEVLGYRHSPPPGVALPNGQDGLEAWDTFLKESDIPEDQHNSASALEDPEGQGPRLYFQRVPEAKAAKNRVHLDVRAAVGLEGHERMLALERECDRLLALGARRLERHEPAPPMSMGFIVMADPEGNEFCLD